MLGNDCLLCQSFCVLIFASAPGFLGLPLLLLFTTKKNKCFFFMFSYSSFIVSVLRVFNPFLVDCVVFKSLKQSPSFIPSALKESLRRSFCLSLAQLEGCRKNGIHGDFSSNPVLHTSTTCCPWWGCVKRPHRPWLERVEHWGHLRTSWLQTLMAVTDGSSSLSVRWGSESPWKHTWVCLWRCFWEGIPMLVSIILGNIGKWSEPHAILTAPSLWTRGTGWLMLCCHPFPTRHISSWSQRRPFTLQSLCWVFSHKSEEHDRILPFSKSVGELIFSTDSHILSH